MRWSLPSIRNAGRLRGDFPEDGEAALGSGRGFGLVSGPESGLGFGGGGLQATGTHEGAKSGADKAVRRVRPEPGADEGQGYSESNRFNGGSNGVFRGDSDRENGLENDHENDLEAQPSGEDGVPEDMATLVLDNSALGAGPASRPGAVGGHAGWT
jgi:hypothetical protein